MEQHINTALEFAQGAHNFLQVHFPDEWAIIIALAVSPLVAIGAKFSKKWDELDDLKKHGIVIAVSTLAVTINYLLKTPTVAPEVAIPAATFLLQLANKPYYKIVIQPLGHMVTRWWSKQVEQALSPVDEIRSAELPQ